MRLKGKTAIITGASRGIGRAIAIEFAKEGCNIILNYARNDNAARSAEEDIKKLGVGTYLAKADVSDAGEINRVFGEAIAFFGDVDILVNNAGTVSPSLFENMTQEQWKKVIDVDLHGQFNCTKSVVDHMKNKGGGRIINLSSIYGLIGAFGQCNYAAAKWGVIGFTKSLALELARHNILVNAIAPGAVETDMTRSARQEFVQKYIDENPLHRMAKPEEVAKVALFLATDATYVNGEVISVNGGHHV